MKTVTYFALVAVFGLLVSCTINPMSMDMTQAVQSARTRSDHDALAKHYDDAAKEMQAKAEEHKKLLAQYESQAKRGVFRRQAQNLISHCQGLVRIYEQAAKENIGMAQSHRELAAEAK